VEAFLADHRNELFPHGAWPRDRTIAVVDPESRQHVQVSVRLRDGYKAHLAVEPETGLITAAALTPANASDGKTAPGLVADEVPGLEILADTAYGSVATCAQLRTLGHHQLIKPKPLPVFIPGGFTREHFDIDHAADSVTCPAGHTARIAKSRWASFGSRLPRPLVRFDHSPRRRTGGGAAPVASPDVVARYRRHHPMVERSIAWLVADGGAPGSLSRAHAQATRAVAAGRRAQSSPPALPRPGQRRTLEARRHLIGTRKPEVTKKGPHLRDSTQPGWPAHDLVTPTLRFRDHFVQQTPSRA
jgi:Transposase DDE domain